MASAGWTKSHGGANPGQRLRLVVGIAFALLASILTLVAAGTRSQAEALDDDNAKFAVMGDYGSASSNEGDVADLIDAHAVDFIVTTGDNSYNTEPPDCDSEYASDVGAFYGDYIGGNPNRFFPSIGNHDTTTSGCDVDAYLSYFDLPGNGVPSSNTSGIEEYYDFIRGPVHFFALDSEGNRNPDGPQGVWLEAQLEASTSQWNVVFFHHPPYTSDGPETDMRWPFEAWGADAVFSGHDHFYERNMRDDDGDGVNMPYFISGLGGKSIYALGAPLPETASQYNGDYGSMIVTASRDSLLFEFYSVGSGGIGTKRDTYEIEASDTADPQVSITVPAEGASFELNTVVNADFACTDPGGSGIDTCVGTVADGEPVDTASLGDKSFTVTGTDNVGNTTVVTHNYTVVSSSDVTDPIVTITSPADGVVVVVGTQVNAAYSCSDSGSGIASCIGSVAAGAPIDTSTLGSKSFSVTGVDAVGNSTTVTVNYTIALFGDTAGSVFENDIEWLALEGITRGCNPPTNSLFCPDDPVSRGQMAAFLKRALSDVLSVDLSRATDFVDTDGSVFVSDIAWLSAAEITRSCNPGSGGDMFCPSGNVTRGQMAAFIRRAFTGLIPAPVPSGRVFTDSQDSIFKDDIQWMADTGISRGCNPPGNTQFCPSDQVSRGQMAAFIRRAFDAAGL